MSNSILQLAVLATLFFGTFSVQQQVKIPRTHFSCQGRGSGYYADLETGCQVYHMCDGLGRQFSYSCPNTTLFQQRMLICDHWYMVNCSNSEKDYSANLLIGQRDKPFVSDSEDHQRTPRPDILSAPYAQGFNNYGGFQEQVPTGSGKGIFDNSIANGNNDLNDEVQFPLPTHWSTELTNFNRFTTAAPPVHKGFTGRPIVITNAEENNFSSNNNRLLSQSTETTKVISPSPLFERDRDTKFSNDERDQHFNELRRNITESQTAQNIPSTQMQDINLFDNSAAVTPPSKFFIPPFLNSDTPVPEQQVNVLKSTTVKSISSFNNELLSDFLLPVSLEAPEESQNSNEFNKNTDAVINFINRFNPDEQPSKPLPNSQPTNKNVFTSNDKNNVPTSKTFEIQSSSATAGFATQSGVNNIITFEPQKTIQVDTDPEHPKQAGIGQKETGQSKILVNVQDNENEDINKKETNINTVESNSEITPLILELQPPKFEYSEIASTTMGPIIYYEWKWAAPAMELEPPFLPVDNDKNKRQNDGESNTKLEGKPDFAQPRSSVTKPAIQVTERSTPDQSTSEGNDQFKVSPYFIPDYVFPLDKQHPGYDEDDAITSFQVRIPHTISDNEAHPYYGENAQCPQCHPSFLVPGTCKPCVMIRR